MRKEEDVDSDSDTSDDDSEDELVYGLSFWERRRGPKHNGISVIQPSNTAFGRLLDYCFYRLARHKASRSSRETGKVRALLKQMELTMKSRKFSGNDPILIFEFLHKFVEEAGTLGMSESQAYLAVPYFLVNPALNEFDTTRAASKVGSISVWPEVVNYLLSTYATPSAIRQAVAEFRAVKQAATETEDVYAQRVNKATYQCGNAFDEYEKMTVFC